MIGNLRLAADKTAKDFIRDKVIRTTIGAISDDIKAYIADVVRTDLPDVAEQVLMMDIEEIVQVVLDFVKIRQGSVIVEIDMDQVTGVIDSILSMVNWNPDFIESTAEYFANLYFDPNVIHTIIVNNIKAVL